MSIRHKWNREGVHRYRCVRCGLFKINVEHPPEGPGPRTQWSVTFEREGSVVATGRTPPCEGAAPTSLTWTRSASGPWEEADSGHRVLACRVGSQWRYTALSPDRRSDGWSYRAWANGSAPHWSGEEPKIHYAKGDRIPQPRDILGVSDTPDEARALCAADASKARQS